MAPYPAKPKPCVGVSIETTEDGCKVYRRLATTNDTYIGRIEMPKTGSGNIEFFFVRLPEPMDRYKGYQWILDNRNLFDRVFKDKDLQDWFQKEVNAATKADKEKDVSVIIEEPDYDNTEEEAMSIKNAQMKAILAKHGESVSMEATTIPAPIPIVGKLLNEFADDMPEFLRRVVVS